MVIKFTKKQIANIKKVEKWRLRPLYKIVSIILFDVLLVLLIFIVYLLFLSEYITHNLLIIVCGSGF